MTEVFGYDPGFGNTKIVTAGGKFGVQSAVSVPKEVGISAMGVKLAKMGTVVGFDGMEFMVGPNSWRWGTPISTMDWSGLLTPEKMALLYSLLAEAYKGSTDLSMVIGLPVPLLQDLDSAKDVTNQLKKLKGEHSFTIDIDNKFSFTISRIRIVAQPVGAYYDYLYNEKLELVQDPSARVAVIDVGQNTIDIYSMQDGQVDPRFIGGSKNGARRVLLQVGNGMEIEEATEAVISGKLKLPRPVVNSWIAQIMDDVESNLGDLGRFGRVILTGGGVQMIKWELAEVIASRGGWTFLPEDLVFSNATGFYKWAQKRGE